MHTETERIDDIAAVLSQSLVVPDEVVVYVARITRLVKRFPVHVERSWSSRVDYVLNEFAKRDWTATLHSTILEFDVALNSQIFHPATISA